MLHPPQPTQNLLLKMLQETGEPSIFSQLELVRLPQGKLLYDNTKLTPYSYFPTTAAISMFFEKNYNVDHKGVVVEIETIRNDGMLGLPAILESQDISRAVVQSTGYAYRIETNLLQNEIQRNNILLKILLKYLQLRISKLAQMSVCSRFHSAEQQISRVLLNMLDYSPVNTIEITHKMIADKLNLRRECVTLNLSNLQRQGIVLTRRGKLSILRRDELEKLCCECYKVIIHETEHLLNQRNRAATVANNNYMLITD